MLAASGGGFGRSSRPGPTAITTAAAATMATTRPRFAQRIRANTSIASNNPAFVPPAPFERSATSRPL